MLDALLDRWRTLHARWRGGTPRLYGYEIAIIERSASVLGEDERNRLMSQVAALDYCQREFADRIGIVVINLRKQPPRLVSADGELLRGVVIRIGPRPRKVAFSVHTKPGGLLATIEFRRPPGFLKGQPIEVVFDPKPWPPRRGPAEAADRLEHGRSD